MFCVITSGDGVDIQEVIELEFKYKSHSGLKSAVTRMMAKRDFIPSTLYADVKGKWHWLRDNPNWVLRRKECKIFRNETGKTLRTYLVPQHLEYALPGREGA